MPFQKGNRLGLGARKTLKLKKPIDNKHPLSVCLYQGDRERLKQIHNWQDLIREYVEKLLDEQEHLSPIQKKRRRGACGIPLCGSLAKENQPGEKQSAHRL